MQALPTYDERRALLARDPLACVHGFQVLVGLVFRHIFGLRFCPRCPDCAQSNQPCMDAFGSNATARGGVFGRIDAIFGSLECQKSGAYHLHGQVFLQCLHQFTPLAELVRLGREPMLELLRKYSDYTAHVQRRIYCNPQDWHSYKQAAVEEEWPEYKASTLMLSRPRYQLDHVASAGEWARSYLAEDVEALQMHKQHHVHIPDAEGVRRPLAHCRDPKDPMVCKAGYPHDDWLTEEFLLICPGLAEDLGMPYKGKKSMTGLLWGPCNDGNLNATHPALLASARCNGDVQVPFRFPITEVTHRHDICGHDCDQKMPIWNLAHAAQVNQAAQAGYACDYQNKRNPIAVQEVKAWMAGQQHLYEELKENKTGYLGARATKRLITDCYGRGVVRGAVESTKLILDSQHNDPTHAECIKTAQVTDIALQFPLKLLEHIAAGQSWPQEAVRKRVDKRDPMNKQLNDCPFWTMYGGRGRRPEVHMLSVYEFAKHYHIKGAKRPFSEQVQQQEEADEKYHALLTEKGIAKVNANKLTPSRSQRERMIAGEDYRIRDEEGGDIMPGWLPLGKGNLVAPYRHDWIIVPRGRPHVPVIYGAQGARTEEEQAMRILATFFPWVNHAEDATAQVPFISDLWQSGAMETWSKALLRHAARVGFPTAEVKHMVMNFGFTYCLPREMRLKDGLQENSDNEGLTDELIDLVLDDEELLEATLTHVRGKAGQLQEGEDEAGYDDGEREVSTKLHDMTMQMFKLSDAIWHQQPGNVNDAARARHAELQHSEDTVSDHHAAGKAAKASQSKANANKHERTGLLGDVALEPRVQDTYRSCGVRGWMHCKTKAIIIM